MSTSRHGRIGTYLRGCAMGAADIIPGVSGGTIALITGIYLRLLSAIGEVPGAAWQWLQERRWHAFWQRVDGGFLLLLMAGILTSVFLLANLITWLMAHQAVLLWSFFCGLILAAIVHLALEVQRWTAVAVMLLLCGAAVAWVITGMTPTQLTPSLSVLFLGGAVAICAMILPGISGSFILLLLGLYGPVLQGVRDLDWVLLGVFAAGCLTGLLSFSRLVAAALRRFPSATLALLTGFMAGALPAVWPWKAPDSGDNLSPFVYAQLSGEPHQLSWALLLLLLGALMVLFLQKGQAVRKGQTLG
ncbi:MAG: DUF368 domain-containing protein [Oleiphilaceae bacterium]|nr:DUF368 domain-containing protein [Oleiphilaceae bacterium]